MKVKKTKNDELIHQLRQLSIRDKLVKNKSRDKNSNSLVKLFGAIGSAYSSSTTRSREISRSFCIENNSDSKYLNHKQRVLSLTRSNDEELTESLFDTSVYRGASFSPSSSCYNSSANNNDDPFSSTAGVLHTTLQNSFKTEYPNASKLRRSYATGLNSSSGYSSLHHTKITNSSSAAALSNFSGFSLSGMHKLYSLIDFPHVQLRSASQHPRRASGSVNLRNSLSISNKQNGSRSRVFTCQMSKNNGPLYCYTNFGTKEDANSFNFQPNTLNSISPFLLLRDATTKTDSNYDAESRALPTNTPIECATDNPPINTPVRTRRNSDPEQWQQHLRSPSKFLNASAAGQPEHSCAFANQSWCPACQQTPSASEAVVRPPISLELQHGKLEEQPLVTTPVNNPARPQQVCDAAPLEEFSVDELASYLEYMVTIPGGQMSEMAQRMYL